MTEIKMADGNYIDYTMTDTSIIFNNDDLMLNLKNREADEKQIIDICADKNNFLVIGTSVGNRYVAQIEIPARAYVENEIEPIANEMLNSEQTIEKTPVPFDIDKCTIRLFGGLQQ